MLEAAAQIGRLKKPRDKETFAVATIFRSGLPSSCHHHKMFKSSREVSNCVVVDAETSNLENENRRNMGLRRETTLHANE